MQPRAVAPEGDQISEREIGVIPRVSRNLNPSENVGGTVFILLLGRRIHPLTRVVLTSHSKIIGSGKHLGLSQSFSHSSLFVAFGEAAMLA